MGKSKRPRGSKVTVTVNGLAYEIILVDLPTGFSASWKCPHCDTRWTTIIRVDAPVDAKRAVAERIRQHQLASHAPGLPG